MVQIKEPRPDVKAILGQFGRILDGKIQAAGRRGLPHVRGIRRRPAAFPGRLLEVPAGVVAEFLDQPLKKRSRSLIFDFIVM